MPSDETTVEIADRSIRITSPDKVMFNEQGWTKLDVINHYLMSATGSLRGVPNRPSLLERWNGGVGERPLFVSDQKGHETSWMSPSPRRTRGGSCSPRRE